MCNKRALTCFFLSESEIPSHPPLFFLLKVVTSTKKQKRDIKKVNEDSLATEMKTKVSAYILFTFIETKKVSALLLHTN